MMTKFLALVFISMLSISTAMAQTITPAGGDDCGGERVAGKWVDTDSDGKVDTFVPTTVSDE